MDFIEKTAKTVDEAVNEALKALNITKDEAEITIIEAGSKGFLTFGAKPAKVMVKAKFDPERAAKNFLNELSQAMGIAVTVETKLKEKSLNIELKGEEVGIFIGKRGQTLDALQYLTNLVVNKGKAPYLTVIIDTENYRKRRKDTLESLAYNLAKKVKATKKKVVLEPMNSSERRIIHSVLQNDRLIDTYSEGAEPFRYVVIVAK